MAKRFYWLKLKQTFFNDLRIKKMLRQPDGDALVVVYIQLLLISLETDGRLYFDGVENDICEEIALGLDRDVSMVQKLLQLLEKGGLLKWDGNDIILTQIPEMTGSETESSVRMRRLRCRKNETEASQCDENVQKCDDREEIENREEIEKEQSRADISASVSKFQDFFSAYPKKKNMIAAEKEYCLLLFNDQNLIEQDLIDAANNYAESVSILGTEDRYIKNPDRFLKDGTYLDYLNVNYTKPTPPKGKGILKNQFNDFQQRDYDFDELEKILLCN